MNINDLTRASVSLRKNSILRLHEAAGQRIECLSGCLWITEDGDPKDSFVQAGEAHTIEHGGDTLVSAVEDSIFVVLVPCELTTDPWSRRASEATAAR